MFYKISIFSILITTLVSAVGNTSVQGRQKKLDKEYRKYLFTVMNCVRLQKGWDSMQHWPYVFDQKTTFGDIFRQKLFGNNFFDVFAIMLDSLNYKYTEVLHSFTEIVGMIINECEQYSMAGAADEFVRCVELVQDGMKNSAEMFDKLYRVLTFLSYLDVTRVFPTAPTTLFVMVDQMYHVKNYIDSMDTGTAKAAVLAELKSFVWQVAALVREMAQLTPIYFVCPVRLDLPALFQEEYVKQRRMNNTISYLDFVSDRLERFYEHTIKNSYELLGFDEVLRPMLYNSLILMPYQDNPKLQSRGTAHMNVIIVANNQRNVQTLGHLSIRHHDEVISAHRILRDPADEYNYHLKRQYVTQLIKCWLYEVLSNYCTRLEAIVELCNESSYNSAENPSSLELVRCSNALAETVRTTRYVFDKASTAVTKMQGWSYCFPKGTKFAEMKRLVDSSGEKFRMRDLARDNVDGDHAAIEQTLVAGDYVRGVDAIRQHLAQGLFAMKLHHDDGCVVDQRDPFVTKEALRATTMHNAEYVMSTTGNPITYWQQACDDMLDFYENFSINEYAHLGFD